MKTAMKLQVFCSRFYLVTLIKFALFKNIHYTKNSNSPWFSTKGKSVFLLFFAFNMKQMMTFHQYKINQGKISLI